MHRAAEAFGTVAYLQKAVYVVCQYSLQTLCTLLTFVCFFFASSVANSGTQCTSRSTAHGAKWSSHRTTRAGHGSVVFTSWHQCASRLVHPSWHPDRISAAPCWVTLCISTTGHGLGWPLSPFKLSVVCGSEPYLIHVAFSLCGSASQLASWSVQPFIQGSPSWQTDRPTHRPTDWPCYFICNSRLHLLSTVVKVKAFHTRYRVLGPELIMVYRQSACRWPGGRLPLLFTRFVVTSPSTEHHRPLAGTKLYCLVTEAHRCEQLAQGCYAALPRAGFEPATYWSQVQCSTRCTTAPPHILWCGLKLFICPQCYSIGSQWPAQMNYKMDIEMFMCLYVH